jgi:hypothetical protein
VGKANFERIPVHTRHHPPGANPRRKQKFGGLSRRSPPASELMAKRSTLAINLQVDAVGFVNQTLIPAQTFKGRAERRTRGHRVEVHVEGAQFSLLGKVQPQVCVARLFDASGEQGGSHADWHAPVRIGQPFVIDPDRLENPCGIVSNRRSPEINGRIARTVRRGSSLRTG